MRSLVPWKRGGKDAAPARRGDWYDRFWSTPCNDFFADLPRPFVSAHPSLDVTENKKAVSVRAEIPGMNEKEIDLSFHDGVLTIRGEKKEDKEEKKKDRYYRECRFGSFSRAVRVGNNVDWQKATAKYRHGVLSVTLPKTDKEARPVEIPIH